ncbi:BCDH BETA1 [Scenedesmus sp. PABB004]|nr:BCDH BETA1 [Scenedesmus sp. PABB004]
MAAAALRRRAGAPALRWLGGSAALHTAPEGGGEAAAAPAARPLNLCSAVNEALHAALDGNEKCTGEGAARARGPWPARRAPGPEPAHRAARCTRRALVFGEDVAFGGVFRCTAGLAERFGGRRVFNTPLNESGIAGLAVGLASQGYVPIAEIQFADYLHPAFDQLVSEAAKVRFRSGGTSAAGLTLRAPVGAVGHGGHYHSQSPEAFYCHVPGLKVVVPSGPKSAKGLLLACIADPDPCIFLEPKILYRTCVEDVPLCDEPAALGRAAVLRQGRDITLLGWGAQVHVLRAAAATAEAQHGIDCEVVDLQTLLPYDVATVTSSVAKTGRLLVSHEAPLTAGFGAELVASITARCFLHLQAPPARVCGADTPFPLAFEPLYLPGVERVLEAIVATVRF